MGFMGLPPFAESRFGPGRDKAVAVANPAFGHWQALSNGFQTMPQLTDLIKVGAALHLPGGCW